jgi:hypothetical protein
MILRQLQTSPTEPITKYNEKTLTSVATTAVFATILQKRRLPLLKKLKT